LPLNGRISAKMAFCNFFAYLSVLYATIHLLASI